MKSLRWFNVYMQSRLVFYGEYKCMGPGADTSKRAKFTKILDDEEVKPFITLNYIDASTWLLRPPHLAPYLAPHWMKWEKQIRMGVWRGSDGWQGSTCTTIRLVDHCPLCSKYCCKSHYFHELLVSSLPLGCPCFHICSSYVQMWTGFNLDLTIVIGSMKFNNRDTNCLIIYLKINHN